MRVGLVLLFASAAAFAQDDLEMRARVEEYLQRVQAERFETVEGLTLVESARIDYGVYTTLGGLAVDDEGGSTRVLGQADSRLWTHASYGGHEAYGRLRFRYRDFDGDGDSFDGRGDDLAEPIGDRWWYRFSLAGRRAAHGQPEEDLDAWVQAGRQYVPWASGLVLSETLYAARAGVAWRSLRAELMYAQTPRTGTIDLDPSRPGFDRDVERHLWGVLVEFETASGHTPYAYLLDQDDENDVVSPILFGYDSTYVGAGSRGPLCGTVWYRVEGVYEFGSSASTVFAPQAFEDISAWAAMVAVEYMPRALDEHRVRFELEFLLASGDDDRLGSSHTFGGSAPGTDDEQFNGFGYAYTGLALAPDLSNLLSVRASASAFPFRGRELRVSLDVFGIFKMDEDAPMSVTTLFGHRHVGVELDVALAWQIFSDLAVDLRYGIFFPGSAIPHDQARHFAYLAVSYGF